jgi:hypothetical protein
LELAQARVDRSEAVHVRAPNGPFSAGGTCRCPAARLIEMNVLGSAGATNLCWVCYYYSTRVVLEPVFAGLEPVAGVGVV